MIAKAIELERESELVTFSDESKWLEGRQVSIGSSDAATILEEGYASSSRYSLWAEKCHGIKPEFATAVLKMLRKGQLAEPYIAGCCKIDFDWDIKYDPKPSFRRNRIRPWLTASLDAWMIEDGRPVAIEIKNVNDFSIRKEWDVKSGKAPLKYTIQLQHQLLVTGWDMGYLVALSGYELYKVPVPRHPSLIEAMIGAYEEFWELVLQKKEPEIDDSDATYAAIGRVYNRQRPPMDAEYLDEEHSEIVSNMVKLEKSLAQDEKKLELYRNKLTAWAKSAQYLVAGDGTVYSFKAIRGGKRRLKVFRARG